MALGFERHKLIVQVCRPSQACNCSHVMEGSRLKHVLQHRFYQGLLLTDHAEAIPPGRMSAIKVAVAQCQLRTPPQHRTGWQVTLTQRAGQAMRLANRCLWDVANDSTASKSYSNDSLYCICEVRQLCRFLVIGDDLCLELFATALPAPSQVFGLYYE